MKKNSKNIISNTIPIPQVPKKEITYRDYVSKYRKEGKTLQEISEIWKAHVRGTKKVQVNIMDNKPAKTPKKTPSNKYISKPKQDTTNSAKYISELDAVDMIKEKTLKGLNKFIEANKKAKAKGESLDKSRRYKLLNEQKLEKAHQVDKIQRDLRSDEEFYRRLDSVKNNPTLYKSELENEYNRRILVGDYDKAFNLKKTIDIINDLKKKNISDTIPYINNEVQNEYVQNALRIFSPDAARTYAPVMYPGDYDALASTVANTKKNTEKAKESIKEARKSEIDDLLMPPNNKETKAEESEEDESENGSYGSDNIFDDDDKSFGTFRADYAPKPSTGDLQFPPLDEERDVRFGFDSSDERAPAPGLSNNALAQARLANMLNPNTDISTIASLEAAKHEAAKLAIPATEVDDIGDTPSLPSPSVPEPTIPESTIPAPTIPEPSAPEPSAPEPIIQEPTIPESEQIIPAEEISASPGPDMGIKIRDKGYRCRSDGQLDITPHDLYYNKETNILSDDTGYISYAVYQIIQKDDKEYGIYYNPPSHENDPNSESLKSKISGDKAYIDIEFFNKNRDNYCNMKTILNNITRDVGIKKSQKTAELTTFINKNEMYNELDEDKEIEYGIKSVYVSGEDIDDKDIAHQNGETQELLKNIEQGVYNFYIKPNFNSRTYLILNGEYGNNIPIRTDYNMSNKMGIIYAVEDLGFLHDISYNGKAILIDNPDNYREIIFSRGALGESKERNTNLKNVIASMFRLVQNKSLPDVEEFETKHVNEKYEYVVSDGDGVPLKLIEGDLLMGKGFSSSEDDYSDSDDYEYYYSDSDSYSDSDDMYFDNSYGNRSVQFRQYNNESRQPNNTHHYYAGAASEATGYHPSYGSHQLNANVPAEMLIKLLMSYRNGTIKNII